METEMTLEQARTVIAKHLADLDSVGTLTDEGREYARALDNVLANTAQPAELDEVEIDAAAEALAKYRGAAKPDADDIAKAAFVLKRVDAVRHAASVGVQPAPVDEAPSDQMREQQEREYFARHSQEPWPSTASVSEQDDPLHIAVCQAVSLMNGSIDIAKSEDGREARDILRRALMAYVPDPEQPASAQAEPVATVTVGDLGTIRAVRWKQELAPGVHPLYLAPPPATSREVPEGTVPVPIAAWYFLTGAAPLDGVWFGERHPAYRGGFWWRGYIANMMDGAAPAAPKEGV